MNGRGDPDGTEYASPAAIPSLEAVMSLAKYLDVPVAEAGGLLMKGTAAPVIKRRNVQVDEERRAAGFVSCKGCGGMARPGVMCGCGTINVREGATLTGEQAMRSLQRKAVPPWPLTVEQALRILETKRYHGL